jgi:uncharacterized MnhB-related membrane protein
MGVAISEDYNGANLDTVAYAIALKKSVEVARPLASI